MLLFLHCDLWSIIGDAGCVVSSLVFSASAFFSFHLLTGKMGTRPMIIDMSLNASGVRDTARSLVLSQVFL